MANDQKKTPGRAAPAKPPAGVSAASANRRAALRAEQEASAKRQRRHRLLIVVAAVVALALVIWMLVALTGGKPTPAPTLTPPTATGPSASPQVNPPDGGAQRAWITWPGSNPKATLVVDQHTDYQCSICKVTENAYDKLFEQLSDQGDIVLRQHSRTFLDAMSPKQPNSSTRAALAAACVDVADNTKYAAYHNAVFANQPAEGVGYTDEQLRNTFAGDAGLTGSALTAFQSCYDAQATLKWTQDVETNNVGSITNPTGDPKYLFGGNDALCYVPSGNSMTPADCGTTGAKQLGVLGTPSFFVNGKQFSYSKLFNTPNNTLGAPLFTTAADLLTFLKSVANS